MKARFSILLSVVLSAPLLSLLSSLVIACTPVANGPYTPPPPQPAPSQPAPGQPPPALPPADAACGPRDCGPRLAMPNGKCADGSMSGPTGRCLRRAEGGCSWEVLACAPPPAAVACVRTGCSGSVCAEAGNDIITTCEMRPEYQCYAGATCERQANGGCGFTQTTALIDCLNNKRKQ